MGPYPAESELRRTFIDPRLWRSWLEHFEVKGLGSLESEVTLFLADIGYHDFENVVWDDEIEDIYNEVKGE